MNSINAADDFAHDAENEPDLSLRSGGDSIADQLKQEGLDMLRLADELLVDCSPSGMEYVRVRMAQYFGGVACASEHPDTNRAIQQARDFLQPEV